MQREVVIEEGVVAHGLDIPLPEIVLQGTCGGGLVGVLARRALVDMNGATVNIGLDLRIVKRGCDVPQDVEGDVGTDVEELPALADPEVGKAVDGLVDQLLHLVVLDCLQRGKNLERKRDGRVVQFLGADVDGAAALAYLHPVLTEGRVGKDIDISGGLVSFHYY